MNTVLTSEVLSVRWPGLVMLILIDGIGNKVSKSIKYKWSCSRSELYCEKYLSANSVITMTKTRLNG